MMQVHSYSNCAVCFAHDAST